MKPSLRFVQILNMNMGFLGIQFGFALQNSNASRILQTFGADIEQISWFWIAAPLTGLLIQPLVGHYSDKTWSRLGRRRPYFLVGAILAAIGLILLPNAGMFTAILPAMFVGAGFLMLMGAAMNVAMEPFRALVADMLPPKQSTLGFSVQTFLIGIGAVIGSWLPYIFSEWLGISRVAPEGGIPDNVLWSFYVGATVLIVTIIWTVVTTKEYSPTELAAFHEEDPSAHHEKSKLSDILQDIIHMPKTMKQLSVVQFFTWIALFGMWVFTTPAVAQHVYGLAVNDTSSETYQKASDWVGIIFGVYNGVAMIYALFIPFIANKLGRRMTHSLSVAAGGIGLISFYFIQDPMWLLLPMLGVGIAWGSILSMPYAILAPALPSRKTGVYMGIFNIFITIPQIVMGALGGPAVKRLFDSESIYALLFSGVFMIIAAIAVLKVKE